MTKAELIEAARAFSCDSALEIPDDATIVPLKGGAWVAGHVWVETDEPIEVEPSSDGLLQSDIDALKRMGLMSEVDAAAALRITRQTIRNRRERLVEAGIQVAVQRGTDWLYPESSLVVLSSTIRRT